MVSSRNQAESIVMPGEKLVKKKKKKISVFLLVDTIFSNLCFSFSVWLDVGLQNSNTFFQLQCQQGPTSIALFWFKSLVMRLSLAQLNLIAISSVCEPAGGGESSLWEREGRNGGEGTWLYPSSAGVTDPSIWEGTLPKWKCRSIN